MMTRLFHCAHLDPGLGPRKKGSLVPGDKMVTGMVDALMDPSPAKFSGMWKANGAPANTGADWLSKLFAST